MMQCGQPYRAPGALIAILILGLACLDVWPDLLGHSPGLVASNDYLQVYDLNGRFFWSAGLCSGAFLIAAFPNQVQRLDRVVLPIVMIAGACCTASYAYPSLLPSLPPAVVAAAAAFATALGYAWIEVRLISITACLPKFSAIVLALVASRVVKMIAVALFGIAPEFIQVPVVCATPVLAGIAIYAASRLSAAQMRSVLRWPEMYVNPLDESSFSRSPLLSDRLTAYVVLVACSVLSAVARALSDLGYWGRDYVMAGNYAASVLPAGIVLALLVYIAFFKIKENEVLVNLGVLFAIVLGGMFLQDVQIGAVLGVSSSISAWLSIAVELFSQFIFWIAMVLAIRQSGVHPYRAVGVGEGSMSAAAFALGVTLFGVSGSQSTLIAASMYGVLIIVLVLLRRAQQGKSHGVDCRDREESIEAVCARIAETHGLSPRESDVFLLLAQGRSRSFIQDELYLSDGTVKTHIRHIYQKLDVHSKQELISLMLEQRS